jgi:hypothetical protein
MKAKNNSPKIGDEITRKDMLKKAGKYAAFTAGTMLLLLSPKESPAQSPSPGGHHGWD